MSGEVGWGGGGGIRNTAIIYESKEPKSNGASAIDHRVIVILCATQELWINKLTFVSTVVHDCEPPHIQKSQFPRLI